MSAIAALRRSILLKKNTKKYYGYQDRKLVDVIIQKNIYLRNNLDKSLDVSAFRIIAAIELLRNQKESQILDFGGGGGHHQAIAQYIFQESKFIWKVIETPSLVNEATQRFNIPDLYFGHEIIWDSTSNTSIDLIHSNSAIQYTEDPQSVIKTLMKLDFKYMYLTRIPLALDCESFEYMQTSKLSSNGPGSFPKGIKDGLVEYRARIMGYEEFKDILFTGCEMLYEFNEGPWDSKQFRGKVGTFTFALRKLSIT